MSKAKYTYKPSSVASKRAFTFVELMLVVVLISFIAVLSTPRMRSALNNLEIYNFANKAASLMRYAQSKAIAELKRVYLVYKVPSDKSEGNFYLAKDDENIISEEGEKIVEIDERYTLSVPSTIKINFEPFQSNNVITFNSDGSIDGPIVIVYNDRRKFQLKAGGGIGRVEVRELFN